MPYIEKTRFYQTATSAPTKTKIGVKSAYREPPKPTWAEELAQEHEGDWFDYGYTIFWFELKPKYYIVKLIAIDNSLMLVTKKGEYINAFYDIYEFHSKIFKKELTKRSIIKTRLMNTIHR